MKPTLTQRDQDRLASLRRREGERGGGRDGERWTLDGPTPTVSACLSASRLDTVSIRKTPACSDDRSPSHMGG
jgi:hypothetical protein